MRHLVQATLAIALLAGSASSSVLAQDTHDHGHAHGGEAATLDPLVIGEWTITATTHGEPAAGGEFNVDLAVKGPAPFPRALRAWIGDETGDLTGKTRIDASGHGHLPVPEALAGEHRLWIEVEHDNSRQRGSIALHHEGDGHDHASDHSHEHAGELDATITVAVEGSYHLRLAGEDGKPLGAADLETSHGAPIHLVIVDASLSDLRHLHPVEASPGKWSFDFTPRVGGAHLVIAEATLAGAAGASIALAEIAAPGAAGSFDATTSTKAERGGIGFELAWDAEPVAAHQARFMVKTTTPNGDAPVLEPILGEAAHVFVLGPDAGDFTHAHAEAGSEALLSGAVTHATPGPKRLFVHLKATGEEHIVPFTYTVAADDHDHGHDDGHGHEHDDGHAHDDGHDHSH